MIDERLLQLLGASIGRDVSFAAPPVRITGGYFAAIYGFELDDPGPGWSGPLVMRVMPNTPSAAKEIVVQRTLAALGFPTPKVLVDGVDEIGSRAFMVMTRAGGSMPLSGLSLRGISLDQLRQLRSLPLLLADVALRLHAVDPTPLNDALAASSLTDRLGMGMYLDLVRGAAALGVAGFADLSEWFDKRVPTKLPTVVCHGDLHPFNLMVDDNGSTTVLDWTNANIAPREFDIGFTIAFLTCAPIEVPAPLRPFLAMFTRRSRTQILARYRAGAALDPDALACFEALQYARCLAEVAQSRLRPGGGVDAHHPFEISALAMTRLLAAITGIAVALPSR